MGLLGRIEDVLCGFEMINSMLQAVHLLPSTEMNVATHHYMIGGSGGGLPILWGRGTETIRPTKGEREGR